MKTKLLLSLAILFTTNFVVSQNDSDFNRDFIVFPGCETSNDLRDCFDKKVINFLKDSIDQNIINKLIKYAKKDTITINSKFYIEENGTVLKKESSFYSSLDSLDRDFKNLINKFPKTIGTRLDNYNNGVGTYTGNVYGFSIDRKNAKLEPIYDYEPKVLPFAIIERVPVYKGCSEVFNNEELRKCMNKQISKQVIKKFRISLANRLGLSKGVKQIYVFFIIDKKGNITKIKARGPHKALEQEAIRVVKAIPSAKEPGRQRGKPVNVAYVLPIRFKID